MDTSKSAWERAGRPGYDPSVVSVQVITDGFSNPAMANAYKKWAGSQNQSSPQYKIPPNIEALFDAFANQKGGDVMADPRESLYNGISGFELYKAWQSGNYSSGIDADTTFKLNISPSFNESVYSEKPVTQEARLLSAISSTDVSKIISGGTPQSIKQVVSQLAGTLPKDDIPPFQPVSTAPRSLPDEQLNMVQDSGIEYISPEKQNLRAIQKIDSYRSRANQFKKRMF